MVKRFGLFALIFSLSCGPGDSVVGSVPSDLTATDGTVRFFTDIRPGQTEFIPSLGTGWDLSSEAYSGQCVSGATKRIAPDVAGQLRITGIANAQKAQTSLGFGIGGKAHYGLGSGSVKAQAAGNMVKDQFSSTWVFMADYTTDGEELNVEKPVVLTAIGEQASKNGTWERDCGDEFVYQVHKGAKLIVLYRLDFRSESAREAVEAAVKAKNSVVEMNAELKALSQMLGKQAKLTIEAYQFGGEPWKLGGIVTSGVNDPERNREGAAAVVKCGIQDISACEKFLTNAVLYATGNHPDAFPQQVERRSSATLYVTLPWERLNLGSGRNLNDELLKNTRRDLAVTFDKIFGSKQRIDALLDTDWLGEEQRDLLTRWQTTLTSHTLDVAQAVHACYDDLKFDPETHRYSAEALRRCMDLVGKLDHLKIPKRSDLRGNIERLVSLRWGEDFGGEGSDPGANIRYIGDVACGATGQSVLCAHNRMPKAQAFVLDLRVYDKWANQLTPEQRALFATYPISDSRQENGSIHGDFFPHSTIYWSDTASGTAHLVHGPILDYWRGHQEIFKGSVPVSDQLPLESGAEQSVRFSGNHVVYWRPNHGVMHMHSKNYDRWMEYGGSTGCLGYPLAITFADFSATNGQCFDRGHMSTPGCRREEGPHVVCYRNPKEQRIKQCVR